VSFTPGGIYIVNLKLKLYFINMYFAFLINHFLFYIIEFLEELKNLSINSN